MANEAHDMPSVGAFAVMLRRYLEGRVAELPSGPRAGGET
jgi:hypothetical protein